MTTTAGTKITVEKATPDTDRTFAIKVTFEPTAAGAIYLPDECNSADIYVKYESQLLDGAKIGVEGNPNESCIKYSNNPEDDDDSDEGKTPDDKVIVFTYKVVVDKVDEKGEDLKGADFTLYKEVHADTENAQTGAAIKATLTGDDVKAKATALKDDKYYIPVAKLPITDDTVQFEFKGIDDGTYVLVETKVPTGYNAWQSVEVKVEATHTEGENPQLTEIGDLTKEGKQHDAVSGEAYTEIVNNSGSELPSTGGMGTTIFYIVGAMLAVGAAVILVTKKRMNG